MKAPTSPFIPECTACPHRKSSDICQLVPSVDEPFGLIKRRTMYQAGQCVFYEGHVALGLYILCQDRVKLTRLNRKGQQRLVDILDQANFWKNRPFMSNRFIRSLVKSWSLRK